jgi:hypothetical protein
LHIKEKIIRTDIHHSEIIGNDYDMYNG